MDHFPGRQNAPAVPQRSAQVPQSSPPAEQPYVEATPTPRAHRSVAPAKKSKKSLLPWVGLAVLVLALVGVLAWSLLRGSSVPGVDNGKFQAVFLTNGQVYFGKLKAVNGDYYKLSDIFYLQANGAGQESDNPQEATNSESPNVQLIKLGNEVHGPEDEMVIARGQVLFFENLKSDGKVSSTIDDYTKTKK
jgi:hypothetical protein